MAIQITAVGGVIHYKAVSQLGTIQEVRIEPREADDPSKNYRRFYHPDGAEISLPGKFSIDGKNYLVEVAKPVEIKPDMPEGRAKAIRIMNMKRPLSVRELGAKDVSRLPSHVMGESGAKIPLDLEILGSRSVDLVETAEILTGEPVPGASQVSESLRLVAQVHVD